MTPNAPGVFLDLLKTKVRHVNRYDSAESTN